MDAEADAAADHKSLGSTSIENVDEEAREGKDGDWRDDADDACKVTKTKNDPCTAAVIMTVGGNHTGY